jgi:hypothetical protein
MDRKEGVSHALMCRAVLVQKLCLNFSRHGSRDGKTGKFCGPQRMHFFATFRVGGCLSSRRMSLLGWTRPSQADMLLWLDVFVSGTGFFPIGCVSFCRMCRNNEEVDPLCGCECSAVCRAERGDWVSAVPKGE